MQRFEQVNRGDRVYSVQGGDLHIHHHVNTRSCAVHRFVDSAPADTTALRGQPSQLLLARNQVVPFIEREREVERLDDWLLLPDRMSALLVHGPGGIGKTRLAAEFARRWNGKWTVLVAQLGDHP